MVNLVKQNYQENIHKYKEIKKELLKLIGNKYVINHVGSTSIPRMIGKNIIDILIGVSKPSEVNDIQNILVNNGYYLGKSKNKYYRFLASTNDETKSGDVHIHIAIINHLRYQDFLILKEYLLSNQKVANDYSKYKLEIIRKYGNNRQRYRKIKSIFVRNTIKEARKYFMEKK